MSAPVLYLVVPCYNEQEVLDDTARKLEAKLAQLIDGDRVSEKSRVAFVNDGSRDNTWELIRRCTERSPLFSGINLAHNEGHQNALLAGLMTVLPHADVTISMDADLQDSPDEIPGLYKMIKEGGYDLVSGYKQKRYEDEVIRCLDGQSRFSEEMLARLLDAAASPVSSSSVISPLSSLSRSSSVRVNCVLSAGASGRVSGRLAAMLRR